MATATLKPFTVNCLMCQGQGSYETRHPQWGSRTCPEAYVQVTCNECEDGKVRYERASLAEQIDHILNMSHGAPYEDVADLIVKHLEDLGLVPKEPV